MARTSYQYTKVVQVDQLHDEIISSAITVALDTVTLDGADQVTVWFKAALSSEEQTTLDGLVTAHVPAPVVDTYIQPVVIDEPKDLDGRAIKHNTPRKIGTYTYYTGSGDCTEDALDVGGDDEDLLCGHHEVGQPTTQVTYFEFNTIANETHLYCGSIQWKDALGDHITFEVVPHVTPYTSGSGTNFLLYGGYLILPAAGNGNITVNPANIKLVQCVANEFGVKPAGYWNATFNPSTKLFENLTPANGNGDYNIFGAEIVLQRFVNKFQLLGTGNYQLPSNDISQMPHGSRFKTTACTKGADHDWWWVTNVNLFRKKTC